jgi:soluble lytic murein transglycosylase-like protein
MIRNFRQYILVLLILCPATTSAATFADVYSMYRESIDYWSSEYSVPVNVIVAVIRVESNGNPEAWGSVGEVGLMQITPRAFADVKKEHSFTCTPRELWSVDTNIRTGTAYLAMLKRKFPKRKGWDAAIRSYNVGVRPVLEGSTAGTTYLNLVKSKMR